MLNVGRTSASTASSLSSHCWRSVGRLRGRFRAVGDDRVEDETVEVGAQGDAAIARQRRANPAGLRGIPSGLRRRPAREKRQPASSAEVLRGAPRALLPCACGRADRCRCGPCRTAAWLPGRSHWPTSRAPAPARRRRPHRGFSAPNRRRSPRRRTRRRGTASRPGRRCIRRARGAAAAAGRCVAADRARCSMVGRGIVAKTLEVGARGHEVGCVGARRREARLFRGVHRRFELAQVIELTGPHERSGRPPTARELPSA